MTRAETKNPPPKSATLSEVISYYPLAAAHLEIIKKNKILLQRDATQYQIEGAAARDSFTIALDMRGRELEAARADRMRWYQAPWLWYTAGVVSGILLVSQTLQIAF